jgi:DNA-directed RNA polymerase subunit M/transcription elongation factor TFIIS
MKATLDFTPDYCPNCGQALALAAWARDDFTAGNVLTCASCGAELVYTQPLAQAGNDPHCAYCGNELDPDEGHKSKIYPGLICDSCYDLER